MVELIPMTEADYDAFMAISMPDHIQGQITAGKWHPDEAEANMERMRQQVLPQGFSTPNHHFFNIVDDRDGQVGGLWYMVVEQDGQPLVFVVDIQVHADLRRRGYGTAAFRIMEDHARELGITTIALNVFDHNHRARAMYEKLGYQGSGESMFKVIEGGSR